MTNPLIKRIQNVTAAGNSYKNTNILKNRQSEIARSFAPAFLALEAAFQRSTTSYIAMRALMEVSADFVSIKSQLSALDEKICADEYDSTHTHTIKQACQRINEEMKSAWRIYLKERTQAISEVLGILAPIISDMPEKKVLDNNKQIFNTGAIGSKQAVKAVEVYIEVYNSLIRVLDFGDDGQILHFLKQLTDGKRVTINDLTDDIRKWIINVGFGDKILLSIGS